MGASAPIAICVELFLRLLYSTNMYKIINAEEVLDLMLNKVSLSRYDQKFFQNLQIYNVLSRKPLTSNQVSLFTKVVQKYSSQLNKLQFDSIELSKLPWTLQVVPSLPEFTQASIKIENNQIILRCPYKQTFIQDFRELKLMIWNRDERFYYTEYGLNRLKYIVNCVSKHYNDIKFCDISQGILNEMLQYSDTDCWNPTLYKRDNFIFIAATNEKLEETIKNIKFDLSLPTLALLSSYGIKFDSYLVSELKQQYSEEDLNLALNREYKHEYDDLKNLIDRLEKIGCDYIQYASLYTPKGQNEIISDIKSLTNIPIIQTVLKSAKVKKHESTDMSIYKMPVLIKSNSYNFQNYGSKHLAKVVELVNSNPIELK